MRPSNVQFANVPKTNQAVWDALKPNTRTCDSKLQHIQKNVLKSSIPVAKVMEELFNNKDKPENIDINNLITTLSDALNFIGTANVDLVKIRKDNIKKDLPKPMQGLCRDPEEFSASLLFGDNLNNKIKEVSELNKVKGKITFDKDFNRRGRGRGRGRGSFKMTRGNFNRNQR